MKTINRSRLGYIDVAKGLLIFCLLYGHMLIFARLDGINDSVMPILQKSVVLYATFFMQTFFFITGFCSSFDKDLKKFLWGNVKSLLIPSYLLVLLSYYIQSLLLDNSNYVGASPNILSWLSLGGPWFIVSLFWAKIAYWFISKLNIRQQLIVIGTLYLIGLGLNIANVIPNYSYHRHVFLMLPYLFLGNFCKKHIDLFNRWITPLAIFGVVSIVGQFIVTQFVDFYTIPTHDANISINRTFYIHIVNVITGTAFILWLSRKINRNHILETFGKGTLLIYLWNGLVNKLVLAVIPYPSGGGIFQQILFHITVYLLIIILFYLLIRLFYETKYLRWIVGKW